MGRRCGSTLFYILLHLNFVTRIYSYFFNLNALVIYLSLILSLIDSLSFPPICILHVYASPWPVVLRTLACCTAPECCLVLLSFMCLLIPPSPLFSRSYLNFRFIPSLTRAGARLSLISAMLGYKSQACRRIRKIKRCVDSIPFLYSA